MDSNRRYSPCRPQTAHPSADPLRGNPCDSRYPRICVSPLKGLRTPCAASVSYRALAPGGAGLPFRITPTHTDPPANVHCTLYIVQWTFTFSAKEKDSETGLSYFGSRYYSSDLSVWLSVDPMSDKYPSLSPYTYCADNSVKLVDPDGEKVLPTSAFQNSAYNKVYQNLSQTNNTYKQILSKYQDDTHDFILDFSTEYGTDAGTNQMSYRKKGDQASVLEGLIEYNSTYKLGYTNEELEILSWSGMQESEGYKEFIEHRAKMNGRTFDEEDNYVKVGITTLTYGGRLDE